MATPDAETNRSQFASILESAEVREMRFTLMNVVDDLLLHDGFGHIEVDMKILKRGQKEVLISCGKEYRFVVNFTKPKPAEG